MSASPFFEGPNPEDCQICLVFCREKGVSWLFFCATRAILLRPNFMQWLFKCSKPLKIINPNSDVAAAAATTDRDTTTWILKINDNPGLKQIRRRRSYLFFLARKKSKLCFRRVLQDHPVVGRPPRLTHTRVDSKGAAPFVRVFFFRSSSSSAWLLMGTVPGINLKQRSHTARPEIDRCVTIYASFWTRNKLTPL